MSVNGRTRSDRRSGPVLITPNNCLFSRVSIRALSSPFRSFSRANRDRKPPPRSRWHLRRPSTLLQPLLEVTIVAAVSGMVDSISLCLLSYTHQWALYQFSPAIRAQAAKFPLLQLGALRILPLLVFYLGFVWRNSSPPPFECPRCRETPSSRSLISHLLLFWRARISVLSLTYRPP